MKASSIPCSGHAGPGPNQSGRSDSLCWPTAGLGDRDDPAVSGPVAQKQNRCSLALAGQQRGDVIGETSQVGLPWILYH